MFYNNNVFFFSHDGKVDCSTRLKCCLANRSFLNENVMLISIHHDLHGYALQFTAISSLNKSARLINVKNKTDH